MPEYIANDIEIFFDDSDRENSDKENSDEKNSDEENYKIVIQKYSYLLHLLCNDSKYVKINSVSPLYLIINKVIKYFEESNKKSI